MKGFFISVLFLMGFFISNISFAGGVYDSVIITDVNDVNVTVPAQPYGSCTVAIVYNAKAMKNGVPENKQITATMTSANQTINLSEYLKVGQLVFNKKAEQDALEMYNILCNQQR